MMEQKRNKFWRKQQQNRVFKNRMVLFASYGSVIIRDNGSVMHDAHWFDLAKDPAYMIYKSTATPCSCMYCKGESYNRRSYKKDTMRIVRETELE